MKTLLTLFALLVPLRAFAFCDDWRTRDTTLVTVDTLLLLADWSQTRTIAASPSLYETNPTLGKHPPAQDVNLHFGLGVAGTLSGACLLDGDQRTLWLTLIGLVEAYYVQGNLSLGVHF